jgi:PAS domain S-box-containing protein
MNVGPNTQVSPFAYAYYQMVADSDGNPCDYIFLDVNDSFQTLFGIKAAAVVGKRASAVFQRKQNDSSNWLTFFSNIAITGGRREFEQYCSFSGKWLRGEVHSDKKHHFSVFYIDVTSKHMLLDALKKLQNYSLDNINYQDITDTLHFISGAGYAIFNQVNDNTNGVITKAISGAGIAYDLLKKLLGFDPKGKEWPSNPVREDQIKRNKISRISGIKDLATGVLPDLVSDMITSAFQIKEIILIPIIREEKLWGDFTLFYLEEPEESRLKEVEVYADSVAMLIARLQAEAELKKQKEQMDSFFNLNLDLLCIADMEGNFLRVNREWEELLGYASEELQKSKFQDFVHPDDLHQTQAALLGLSNKHDVLNLVTRFRTKHGIYRFIEWKANSWGKMIFAAARDISKRIEAEEAVKLSERQFRSLFHQTNDAVFILDLHGVQIALNDRAAEMMGYKKEEMPGLSIIDISAEPTQSSDVLKRLLAGEKIAPYERLIRKKNGDIIAVEVNAQLVSDTGGKPLFIQSINRDITERRKNEQMLREKEALLKKLSKQVPGVIYQFQQFPDGSSCFPYVSDNVWEIYHITAEEIMADPMKVFNLIHPEDMPLVAEKIAVSFNQLTPFEVDFRIVLPLKGQVWFMAIAQPEQLEDGSVLWHGFNADITQRKNQEQLITRLKEQYELAINGTNDGLWDWDINTGDFFISNRWKQMIGYEPDELVNQVNSFNSNLYKPDYDKVYQHVEDYLSGKIDTYDLDFRMHHKNGSLVWVKSRASAVYDETGKPIRMIGFHTDISQNKIAQEEILNQSSFINSLLNSIPDCISYKDLNGRFIGCNPAFEKFFGKTLQELKGKTAYEIFGKKRAEAIFKAEQQILKTGNGMLTEEIFEHAEGKQIFDSLRVPIKDHAENIIGLLRISRNITEREKTQEQINTLSMAVHQSPASIVITDTEANIEYVNKKFTQLTGYSFEEVVGKNPQILKSEIFGKEYYETFSKTISTGQKWRGEFYNKKKNGEYYWESATISPFKDKRGKITRYVAIKEDITERKAAEQKIVESEMLLRTLLENISVGVAIVNPQTRVIEVINEYGAKLVGASKEVITGKQCHFIINSPSEGPCPFNENPNHIEHNERMLQKADGTQVPILKTVRKVQLAGKDVLLESFVDISIQKRAQQALMKNERLLNSVLQSQKEMILRFSKDLIITFANEAYASIYNITPTQVIGKSLLDLIPASEHTGFQLRIQDMWEGKADHVSLEKSRIYPDGSIKWFQWTDYLIKDNEGALLEFQCVGYDITDKKEKEKLEREVEIARHTLKFKQTFLASMSHEMRTPLAGIVGVTQLLGQTPLQDDQFDYLAMLRQSSESLSLIIDQVLDYSRIETGKVKLNMERHNPGDLLRQAATFFSGICNKPITLIQQPDTTLPPVLEYDQARISQVINNLLINAVQNSHSGEVTIKMLRKNAPVSQPHAIMVGVEISDTRNVIDHERLKNVFSPFAGVHEIESEKYTGLGLELVICKEIVELHGGKISIESTEERGTVVSFYFEATLPRKSVKITCKEEDSIEGLRILLVEDNHTTQKVVTLMLNAMGHTICIAGNGQEAIDQYTPGDFDLILMDIQMPVMDGLSATRAILRKYPDAPPVVGFSANVFEGDKTRYMAAGMSDFLPKPLRMDDFRNMVQRIRSGVAG